MAASVHPLSEAPCAPLSARRHCEAPAMDRCECAGTSFEELGRLMSAEGLSFEETSRRSGCGQTCTACVPDLRAYLAALRRS
jgi:bacterioferritin-associated ferredoxin